MVIANTRRLVLAELLIFFSLAGLSALLSSPVMGLINKNTGIIQSKLIETLEKDLNRPIRYDSMGPSVLRTLEFHTIALGAEPEPLARVDYLCLDYSLWSLFRGKGAGAIRTVVLDKPEIHYNAGRDNDILDRFSSGEKTSKPFVLPPNCRVDISNGTFISVSGKHSFGITSVNLDGEIQKKLIRVNGNWNVIEPAPEGLVTSRGSVSGAFAKNLKDGIAAVYIDSIEGSDFQTGMHAIAVSFLEDRIHIERIQDSLPLKLYADYLPEKKELAARFFADAFLLEKMVHFSGNLEKMETLTALSLSGDASLSAVFPGKGKPGGGSNTLLDYRFNVAAEHTGQANAHDTPLKAFAFEGKGNNELLTFNRFNVEANHGMVNYNGDILLKPFLPQGTMRFSGFSLTGESDINGNLEFTRENRSVKVNAPSLSFGAMYLSSFEGGFFFENGGGHYALMLVQAGAQGANSRFAARGSFSQNGKPATEAAIGLDSFYAADLVNLARPFVKINAPDDAAALRDTALTTELVLRTDFNGFSFQTRRFLASFGDKTFLSASISGSEKQISISDGKVWQQESIARFEGGVNYADINNVGFNAGINANINAGANNSTASHNFAYAFTGKILNKNTVTVEGSHGFFLTARQSESGSWAGSMRVSSLPVPFRGHKAYIRVDSSLQYRNIDFWTMNLIRFEVKDPVEQLELTVHGSAHQNGFNLDRIFYTDSLGPLEGSAAAVWNGDFSFIDGSFVFNDRRETEILTGSFFYEKRILEYKVSVQSFKLDRLVKSGKNLRITSDLSGKFSGKEDYTVICSLDSITGRNREDSFYGSANIELDSEQIIISKARFSMGGINAEMPHLFMDHGAGRLEAEIRAGGRKNGREFGSDLSLGVNFTPVETWFDQKDALNSLSGILEVRYAFIDNIESDEPFSFVFSRISAKDQDSVIRLSGGPEDMLNLEFMETKPGGGVFAFSLSNPSPVQGTVTGTLEGSVIDALASGLYIDMGGLWDIVPAGDTFRFSGGFISGETRIYGSIFDPEFSGSAWGSGLRIALPYYIPAEIGPGSGPLTLEGSDMSFGPVAAPCAYGNASASGWFSFNRWIPSFYLDVEVDKGIPFDFNISGFIAKGNATGNLKFRMENDEIMYIEGVVDVVDTEITLDTNELEREFAQADSSRKMDIVIGGVEEGGIHDGVRINASRRVEFLWPNASAPVLRAYGETETGVIVKGDTRIPTFSLDGTITLRGGEYYYIQRSFMIREGALKFNGSDSKIDPFISARAEVRDQNDDGPVIISMIVDNVPLRELNNTVARFESTPSISQVEIYSMLGQSPAGNQGEGGQNLSPIIYSATDILEKMFFRGVEQNIRNALGLDMFSFRTQILQNAVYEGLKNRQPDEKAVTMGNFLDNTTVFAGKYVGQDMFVQTMVSFKYDPYQTSFGGIMPEMDIGLDLRTPLFDVRWSINPTNMDKLFVSDQSISLVWRWSL